MPCKCTVLLGILRLKIKYLFFEVCLFLSAPTGFQAAGYSFHSHEWRNAKPNRGSLSPVNSGRQRNNILPDFGLGVDEWDRPSASGYVRYFGSTPNISVLCMLLILFKALNKTDERKALFSQTEDNCRYPFHHEPDCVRGIVVMQCLTTSIKMFIVNSLNH